MRTKSTIMAVAVGAFAAVGIALAAYPRFAREWCLHWGATEEEAEAKLPGDELLSDPDILSTRAVTIDAPAAAIWPWIVQMGPGRGGAYTYDWIENLMGLDMHSARRDPPGVPEPPSRRHLPTRVQRTSHAGGIPGCPTLAGLPLRRRRTGCGRSRSSSRTVRRDC